MTTQRYGLNWMAAFAKSQDKAIMLPEWGLDWASCSASGQPISASGQQVCGGDDSPWVNLMATWITTHHVLEATYWDFGTSTVGRRHNPLTVKAFPRAPLPRPERGDARNAARRRGVTAPSQRTEFPRKRRNDRTMVTASRSRRTSCPNSPASLM